MPIPAFVRLGPSSADKSKELNEASAGLYPQPIELTCAQVPGNFGPGSPVWLWLGSDNNKGQATEWVQGIRAFGICQKSENVPGTKKYEVVLDDVYIFPRSVAKAELLQSSPETYARSLADAAIIGLDNYSSQVVQLLTDDEFATIGALICFMIPEIRVDLERRLPSIAHIKLYARPEDGDDDAEPPEGHLPIEDDGPPYESELLDDDPILISAKVLLKEDRFGGVLLQGPPGTGKSWYAKQIAIKLTDGERKHIRQVQFHPSYQYEDFVEGYVPHGSTGFKLKGKHLLEMLSIAKDTGKPTVIVIDEFSRTDPSRVLGEIMTYMEGSLRDVEFSLASGRKISLPANLLFVATMNPEDRSVDEIDDAMDRRWAKLELTPDAAKVGEFLRLNGAPGRLIGAVRKFFIAVQRYLPIGHAFFRNVRDVESLKRLWDSQLKHIISKRFRYDQETMQAINDLWEQCLAATVAQGGLGAEPPQADFAESPPNP